MLLVQRSGWGFLVLLVQRAGLARAGLALAAPAPLSSAQGLHRRQHRGQNLLLKWFESGVGLELGFIGKRVVEVCLKWKWEWKSKLGGWLA